jgi:hypothetical protein
MITSGYINTYYPDFQHLIDLENEPNFKPISLSILDFDKSSDQYHRQYARKNVEVRQKSKGQEVEEL